MRENSDVIHVQASQYQNLHYWYLMLNFSTIVTNRNDKLYNKTIVDYWSTEYDADIHHWIPLLTSAFASVSIGILWWISRHIQYLCSQ